MHLKAGGTHTLTQKKKKKKEIDKKYISLEYVDDGMEVFQNDTGKVQSSLMGRNI